MPRIFVTALTLAAIVVASAHVSVRAADDVREVKAQDLTLKVPSSWKQQQPSNNLRLAQFTIPPVEGDNEEAELVVFPPFGGTAAQNIERWIAQFQADGRKVKMHQGKSDQGAYIIVELAGTYKKPDGPPFLRKTKPTPGYRMVAVILTPEGGGNYFLKVTGPDKTVQGATSAFRSSFGADADKEEEYKIEQ